ncbi:hypothetical protein H9L25_00490 [Terrisporobacter mayombei]|nr:hypothetical protein [Terrisporobacter mayombei]
MARKVKCRSCNKLIDINNAYKIKRISSTGKTKQNLYYCNKTEYDKIENEKEYYKKTQYLTDEIFGYPICNNSRNRMLSDLNKVYEYEVIYECISFYKNEIINLLEIKNIEEEYPRLCYMFAIIKGNIRDFSINNKPNQNINEEVEEVFQDFEEIKPTRVNKARKSLKDRLRG